MLLTKAAQPPNGCIRAAGSGAVKPYTESRQAMPNVGQDIRIKPCAKAESIGYLPKCALFEYIATTAPRSSSCVDVGDLSCWIEIIYGGKRGWIASGTSCTPGLGTPFVSYAGMASCPVKGEQGQN